MSRRINPVIMEAIMRENGNNISEAARKIGVSRSTLWKIARGLREPGGEFMERFKRAYPEYGIEETFFLEDA